MKVEWADMVSREENFSLNNVRLSKARELRQQLKQ